MPSPTPRQSEAEGGNICVGRINTVSQVAEVEFHKCKTHLIINLINLYILFFAFVKPNTFIF